MKYSLHDVYYISLCVNVNERAKFDAFENSARTTELHETNRWMGGGEV